MLHGRAAGLLALCVMLAPTATASGRCPVGSRRSEYPRSEWLSKATLADITSELRKSAGKIQTKLSLVPHSVREPVGWGGRQVECGVECWVRQM